MGFFPIHWIIKVVLRYFLEWHAMSHIIQYFVQVNQTGKMLQWSRDRPDVADVNYMYIWWEKQHWVENPRVIVLVLSVYYNTHNVVYKVLYKPFIAGIYENVYTNIGIDPLSGNLLELGMLCQIHHILWKKPRSSTYFYFSCFLSGVSSSVSNI